MTEALIGVVAAFILIFARVPLAVAIGIVGFVGFGVLIFFPIIVELGFDPVWFGSVVAVSVEIGLLTPPIGINVFVLRSVLPDVATSTIFRGARRSGSRTSSGSSS